MTYMTSSTNNPYIVGRPVSTPEMFFGRQDVFDFVKQHLMGKHQNNALVLYGQRRTGKTSILYQMSRHLGEVYIPILIDLQTFSLNGLSSFLWELTRSIYNGLPPESRNGLILPDKGEYLLEPRVQFEQFLKQVVKGIGERHLLLMFDETVRLAEVVQTGQMDRIVFNYLRGLMEQNERLDFIFSLSSQLEAIRREFGILFTSALYKHISFLEPNEARRLITEPVRGLFAYEPGVLDRILELTNGHPYYTQLVCHSLFARWQANQDHQITIKDVDIVLPEVLERGLAVLQFIWEEAPPLEQQIMIALASHAKSMEHVSRDELPFVLKRHIGTATSLDDIVEAIKQLADDEIVTSRGSIRFLVPLLQLWMVEQELKPGVDQHKPFPILAVMGTKGGVGKTTIAARMAELIAEAGNNVLIIDFDISDAGSTIFHAGRQRTAIPPTIRTALDHVLPYSKRKISNESSHLDDSLCQVTPLYLAEKEGTGQIYLIPSRPLQLTITGKWEAIADIEAGRRSDILLDELDNILRRATPAYDVDCVIIDCGAEFNPLVSAAFFRATHGFIVTLPNPEYFHSVQNIKEEHRARYPDTQIRNIHTIVNRTVSGEDVKRLEPFHPIGFVPDDPQLYEDWTRGTPDFNLGYDNVSLEILNILARTLGSMHPHLLPDPIDIWIAPWMKQINDRKLPQRILNAPEFKRKTNLGRWGLIAGTLLTFISMFFFIRLAVTQSATLEEGQAKVAIIEVGSVAEAQAVQARLAEGRDFESLAKAYSTNPQTNRNGGAVDDFVNKNDVIPGIGQVTGLQNCITGTEAGKVCDDILKLGDRYYLVQVIDKGSGNFPYLARFYLIWGGLLVGVALAIYSFVVYRSQKKKRARLLEVEAHGADKEYLKNLVQNSSKEKGALRWLHDIWKDAIISEREALRRAKYAIPASKKEK